MIYDAPEEQMNRNVPHVPQEQGSQPVACAAAFEQARPSRRAVVLPLSRSFAATG